MPGKEFHPFHEIIYFIGGSAELITENIHTDITPKTLIFIPKETYHQLNIVGDEDAYCRCLINFEDELAFSELCDVLVSASDGETEYLFEKLISCVNSDNREKILSSVLVLLLEKISRESSDFSVCSLPDPLLSRCIDYIDSNIGNDLSIGKLSRVIGCSPSSLSHLFKKELNTSLHRYILKKRLISAHQKLETGIPATNVALECGFNDYSGFYKQYKNMFGFPPSKGKKTRITDNPKSKL